MGSSETRLRVPCPLEGGLRHTRLAGNRLSITLGELREYQVCCGWGQGIPGGFREFRSPRSEFSRYLLALGNTKSTGGGGGVCCSVGIKSAGEHQMSLQGTRTLGSHFTGYQVP